MKTFDGLSLLRHYGIALAIFVIADMVWLGLMAPRFYRPILADIAAAKVNLAPAIVFYALYPLGLVIFAVGPALREGSLAAAFAWGGLFGFFTYLTYDLSNQATLRSWTSLLSLVDVAWGVALGGSTAAITLFVSRAL